VNKGPEVAGQWGWYKQFKSSALLRWARERAAARRAG
jgi:hypothetical protein